jgi:bacterioferritin (cytochrome b1)
LSTYREAEVRGAELLQRLLRDCVDAQMTISLTQQLADEAYHIQMLTDLISELGGTPTAIHKKALPFRYSHDVGTVTLESLAYLYATEKRLQQRYRDHASQHGQDARIVSMLQTLASDEKWHLSGVEALLLEQQKKFGITRVTAMLDYYWDVMRHT